tara:strand:+ start:121 stop:273 length:153 start_codon:yes stop_codon:yes gene_type:complete
MIGWGDFFICFIAVCFTARFAREAEDAEVHTRLTAGREKRLRIVSPSPMD